MRLVQLIVLLGAAVFVDQSTAWFFRPGGFFFPLNVFTNLQATTTSSTTTAATTTLATTTATTPSPVQQISAGFISGQVAGQGSLIGGYPYPNLIGGTGGFAGGIARPPGGGFPAGYFPTIGGLATAAGK